MQKNIAVGNTSFFFVTGIEPMAFNFNYRSFKDGVWISLQLGSWMFLVHTN
jgi:hypothetical protein